VSLPKVIPEHVDDDSKKESAGSLPTEMTATWKDCIAWADPELAQNFHRRPSTHKRYEEERAAAKGKYNSPRDRILIHEFGCAVKSAPSDSDPSVEVLHAIVDETTPTRVWVPNMYPYDIADDITHDLIFSITPISEEEIIATIEKKLDTKIYEYVWWENALRFKSVPDLWHIQIMYRLRDGVDISIPADTDLYDPVVPPKSVAMKRTASITFIDEDDIASGHGKPPSWEDCVRIVAEKSFADFQRHPDEHRAYLRYREETEHGYTSIKDRILIDVFKWPSKKGDADMLEAAKDESIDDTTLSKLVWIKNRFPYHISDEINHALVLSMKEPDSAVVKEFIEKQLVDMTEIEYIWWPVADDDSQMHGIWHAHVLYREKE
jgi:hypothetical protein